MTVPELPELPAYGDLHPIDTPEAAMTLGQTCTLYPVPTLFELHRVVDVTEISGTGRIAVGVIWPFDGGALMRWSTPRPPAGYPFRVRQIEIVDSIAEIMGVHGHAGATRLRLLKATAATWDTVAGPLDHDAPQAFAILDVADDVNAWGVWWPRDERVAAMWPGLTLFTGRPQVPRITQYRTLHALMADLRNPGHGPYRVVHLDSDAGRRLVERAHRKHRESLERAAVAMDLATRGTPNVAALWDQLGAPRRP